jgi:hypothetical protein
MNFIFFFDINRRCRDQRAQTKLEAKIGLDRGLKVLLAAGELEAVDVRHQDSSQPADRRQDDFEEQQFVARPDEA